MDVNKLIILYPFFMMIEVEHGKGISFLALNRMNLCMVASSFYHACHIRNLEIELNSYFDKNKILISVFMRETQKEKRFDFKKGGISP